jgi:hypothetical protein
MGTESLTGEKSGRGVTLSSHPLLVPCSCKSRAIPLLPLWAVRPALKFRSEAWVLKKREEQRLEAAQMKFHRHLLGITKLDKEKNQCIRGKTGTENIIKKIKQYQEK